MKRVLPVLVLAGSAVLLLAPFSTCPDCLGVVAALDPGIRKSSVVLLGCPRCGDGGRVSAFDRWTRRGLHPDLARLARSTWVPPKPGSAPDRIPLVPPFEGFPGSLPFGAAVFVDDGADRLLAVAVQSFDFDALRGRVRLVLYSHGGAVLDDLELAGAIDGEICKWGWLGGSTPAFRVRVWKDNFTSLEVRRGAARTRHTSPEVAVRARRGKIEVIEAETPK